MTYDDIRKDLVNLTTFLRGLKKDISSGQIRNYMNVLNALKRLGKTIRSLEKILDKQVDKTICRKCDYIKNSAKELQDIVSDSISKPSSYIKVTNRLDDLIDDLNDLSELKPAETKQKSEGSKIMITARTSMENWEAIKSEYDISKIDFARKIKFVKDKFKKNVIFRDVEQAFVLASQGFSKPALILSGGVIEELLRLYLKHKKIKPKDETFFYYIQACEYNKLLKRGVFRLSDSIRDFRNLVHLKNEEAKRHTVSQATAKGAVASIFTIANDFQ